MRVVGSQTRESYSEAGYRIIRLYKGEALLEDSTGKKELWVRNNHFAGYVVEIAGVGYEFVESI